MCFSSYSLIVEIKLIKIDILGTLFTLESNIFFGHLTENIVEHSIPYRLPLKYKSKIIFFFIKFLSLHNRYNFLLILSVKVNFFNEMCRNILYWILNCIYVKCHVIKCYILFKNAKLSQFFLKRISQLMCNFL